jgi:hypothetical protein
LAAERSNRAAANPHKISDSPDLDLQNSDCIEQSVAKTRPKVKMMQDQSIRLILSGPQIASVRFADGTERTFPDAAIQWPGSSRAMVIFPALDV